MIDQKLLNEFEELFERSTDKVLLPYEKGNTIRIGDYAVIYAQKQNSYKIRNVKEDILLMETFSKAAAIALAVTMANNRGKTKELLDLDKIIQKNYMDGVFFKHTIKVTKDDARRFSAITRYEIAKQKTKDARSRVENILFGSLTK